MILRTGWLLNAKYEWHQHVRIAQEWRFTDVDFCAIEIGEASPHWSPEERLALRATEELRAECCVSDATWAELGAHLSLEQRMDLVGAVGQYTLVSYMLNSFGVQLEDHFDDFGVRYAGADGRWAQ